jgi:hypothetical protein
LTVSPSNVMVALVDAGDDDVLDGDVGRPFDGAVVRMFDNDSGAPFPVPQAPAVTSRTKTHARFCMATLL